MSKFKVGDRVMCTDASPVSPFHRVTLEKGGIYTVKMTLGSEGTIIGLEEDGGQYRVERFNLVSHAEPEEWFEITFPSSPANLTLTAPEPVLHFNENEILLIKDAASLIEGTAGENPEYERGMFELIMLQTGRTSDDIEAIKAHVYNFANNP